MTVFSERTLFRILVAALILGALFRLYPVVAGEHALAQAFMTEDGYLMLTIARNMAIGLGMSVSDGVILSNGVQPLATFIFSIPYVLTGGDKVTSLIGIHLIAAAFSVLALFSVRVMASDLLKRQTDSEIWPWMVATLWFVGPLLLFHTMNGLETGLYTLMVMVSLVAFGRLLAKGDQAKQRDRLVFGAICGVTFLARNDAVFLLTAIWIVWAGHDLIAKQRNVVRVAADLIPPGILSIVIASPWLVSNYINFGSIVPVSGTAQSLSGGFARNIDLLPAVLFEQMLPMLPVPNGIQTQPVFQLLATLFVVGVLLIFVLRTWRSGGFARYAVLAYFIFAVVMSAYYGFYFGAGWFLSRYLSPLSPLLLIAVVSLMISLAKRLTPKRAGDVLAVLGLGGIVLSLVLLGRLAIPGVKEQGHFQVVDWVVKNVSDEQWVGAVQTGTVGYWHDRTINLDGKVNPAALNAILTEGHVLNYVLNSDIQYLADWHGLTTWTTDNNQGVEAFSDAFEVIVDEPRENLAVLRRK